jgi:hypothetical protein
VINIKHFEGPLRKFEPQPKILLIIRADDKTHKIIKNWLRKGQTENASDGLSASELSKDMIIARTEIFFDVKKK